MAKNSDTVLRKGTKVVAAIDLRGVPSGTQGIVRAVVGVTWIRCRVDFVNGISVGSLDASMLAAAG